MGAARFLAFGVLTLVAFALVLRWRVQRAGLTITSQFRTPWHNFSVGGVDDNTHMTGLAFDVVPATAETEATMRRLGFRFVLNEGDHVHAEYFNF